MLKYFQDLVHKRNIVRRLQNESILAFVPHPRLESSQQELFSGKVNVADRDAWNALNRSMPGAAEHL
jgi:hypothetical protein